MDSTGKTVVRHPADGRRVAVTGDVYRFLATGEDTGGRYACWEALVPPGGGPPPHVHSREQESFLVLEGEMTVYADGTRTTAGVGTFVQLPPGSLHWFKNESSAPARMIITVAPAGLEHMFFETGFPLSGSDDRPRPVTPEEIERLLKAAPAYGIEIRLPEAG